MSYENMNQTTTELYNNLERVMAMATTEHGMIEFSVGVARMKREMPHGELFNCSVQYAWKGVQSMDTLMAVLCKMYARIESRTGQYHTGCLHHSIL